MLKISTILKHVGLQNISLQLRKPEEYKTRWQHLELTTQAIRQQQLGNFHLNIFWTHLSVKKALAESSVDNLLVAHFKHSPANNTEIIRYLKLKEQSHVPSKTQSGLSDSQMCLKWMKRDLFLVVGHKLRGQKQVKHHKIFKNVCIHSDCYRWSTVTCHRVDFKLLVYSQSW